MTPFKAKKILVIVEGEGDRDAVPSIVKRQIKAAGVQGVYLHEDTVISEGRGNLTAKYDPVRSRGVEHYVEMAVRKVGVDGVLIVLDSDKLCGRSGEWGKLGLGRWLRHRATAHARGKPVEVVLAHPWFEAWLVAGWDHLAPHCAVRDPNAISHADVQRTEQLGDHDKRLAKALGSYKKTIDQGRLAQLLPLEGECLRCSPSYGRLLANVLRLAHLLSSD